MSIETAQSSYLDTALAERKRTDDDMQWAEPKMFDLSVSDDVSGLEAMMQAGDVREVVDNVEEIATDLFEMKNPDKVDDPRAREEFVAGVREQGSAYGKWFLFPWSGQLVRYPDKEDHRALRTSRNRNLVTDEEQTRLYGSTVAIFGLSVGSKVVEQLVGSGIGGRVIIGDRDKVSPSNLNRIQGSFADVGMQKVSKVAREISVADPYIEQVHFTDGITSGGLERLSEYSPDVIFDEVDHLPTKAMLRGYAQESGTALIMATDLGERSIIDVERHDLGAAQPFKGRLSSSEFESLLKDDMDEADMKRAMVKIVGMRYLTTRLLDSVMEVGESLSGLPQLGVTASVGGALASTAAREIILGRKMTSGRSVYAPNKILGMQRQATFNVGLRTALRFVRTMKAKKAETMHGVSAPIGVE
jgi:molybdopterin/thiamine biosynthesis adenylyltransferase